MIFCVLWVLGLGTLVVLFVGGKVGSRFVYGKGAFSPFFYACMLSVLMRRHSLKDV